MKKSQYGQDEYIANLFNKRDGVFLDIGASNGMQHSNTYHLETDWGWTGICVEPIKSAYDKLVESRGCLCVNCCLSDYTGTATFLEIDGYSEQLSGIKDNYDPRHLARIRHEINEKGQTSKEVEVPCTTLNALLDSHGITQIDYCSMDVEGSEMKILEATDWSRVDIKVLTIENNYEEDFKTYMEQNGFIYMTRVGIDDVYRSSSWFLP